MKDRNLSLGCAVTVGLWTMTLILLVASVMVESLHVSQFGLAFSAAAAAAQVRQYHVASNRLLREMFSMGYEMGRSDQKVSPLR